MDAKRRAELAWTAAPLAVALLALGVSLGIGGAGLAWNDEFFYANAGREVAAGRPPRCFGMLPMCVAQFGYPYLEQHARGPTLAIALVFRLLGPSELGALLPSLAATAAIGVVAFHLARGIGLTPPGAVATSALVTFSPTIFAFAATTFPETEHALGMLLVAWAAATKDRARILLAVLGTAIAVSFRETAIVLPFALALGILATEGRKASFAAPALALALGLVVLYFTHGPTTLGPASGGFRRWMFYVPLRPAGFEDSYTTMTAAPPIASLGLVLERVWLMLPAFFLGGDAIPGTWAIVLSIHATLLASLPGLRNATPGVRALAIYGLAVYVVKAASGLAFHELPGLLGRHIAAEALPGLVVVAALAARRPGAALGAFLLLLAFFVAIDVTVARGHAQRLEKQRLATSVLADLAPPAPGVIATELGWRLTWERPGQETILPPHTEAGLAAVVSAVPVSRLVLDLNEPLVARTLLATGHAPERLGEFTRTRTDRRLGATLLVYERAK